MSLFRTIKTWFHGLNQSLKEKVEFELDNNDTSEISFRVAESSDIQALLDIMRNVYEGELPWTYAHFAHEILGTSLSLFILAEKVGQVIGFIGVRADLRQTDLHITNFAVRRDFQGQGIGELLFNQVFTLAKNIEARKISLEVDEGNLVARNFYQKRGFEIRDFMEKYYENGDNAIAMARDLT